MPAATTARRSIDDRAGPREHSPGRDTLRHTHRSSCTGRFHSDFITRHDGVRWLTGQRSLHSLTAEAHRTRPGSAQYPTIHASRAPRTTALRVPSDASTTQENESSRHSTEMHRAVDRYNRQAELRRQITVAFAYRSSVWRRGDDKLPLLHGHPSACAFLRPNGSKPEKLPRTLKGLPELSFPSADAGAPSDGICPFFFRL